MFDCLTFPEKRNVPERISTCTQGSKVPQMLSQAVKGAICERRTGISVCWMKFADYNRGKQWETPEVALC
uniref:Uncharacterized protein n=1 Tax=Vespula pensylvanica TaxID=30213 RepID=A0A834NBT4_VESPE|nr:hypothetical protein H0235_014929 [Vespula pensylvanica]